MKTQSKIVLMLLFGVSSTATAQNTNVFQNNMNVIYQHVNRSHVTTGLLNDYGIYFTNIDKEL